MAEELKACPFCGGAVRFHSDEDCHGCHYIECGGCKAMFDFSPTTDPENQCDTLHELQCGIAHTWNTRAQPPSQGGEAVAWRVTGRDGLTVTAQYPEWAEADCLLTITPLYTNPADQVAEGVVVQFDFLLRIEAMLAGPKNYERPDCLKAAKEIRQLLTDSKVIRKCKHCSGGPQFGHAWSCPELPG